MQRTSTEDLARQFQIDDVPRLERALRHAKLAFRLEEPDKSFQMAAANVADHLEEALRVLDHFPLSDDTTSDGTFEAVLTATETDENSSDDQIDAAIDRFDARVQAVRELRDQARAASEGTPARSKRGRPKHANVRRFVSALATYWREDLQREFTQDFNEDEPVSWAAQFVVEAARCYDVQATNSQIRNQMRVEISTYNKSR